jgi:hypothetical protein
LRGWGFGFFRGNGIAFFVSGNIRSFQPRLPQKMTKIFGLILLSLCILAAKPLLAQQKQRFLTGIYLQGGPSTYRPFRDIHFCYEAGGTGSYPISQRLTWDINLGYSHNGLSRGEYTRVPGTNNYVVGRITKLNQVRLEFGIGIPDRKRVRWTFGGFVAAMLVAREREERLTNSGPKDVNFTVTDQFRKYDFGAQIAMHGTLSEHLQIDLKLRQGFLNLRPGWEGIATCSQAALVGFSWFPSFAVRER